MSDLEKIASIAEQVATAHMNGKSTITINGVTFNMKEKGMCEKFVRQVHECALGLNAFSWEYGKDTARNTEIALKADNRGAKDPVRGDIIAMNNQSYYAGHIGIYLGNGKFAENTSSTVRGPGTVISNISDIEDEISGYYQGVPGDIIESEQEVSDMSDIIAVVLPGYQHSMNGKSDSSGKAWVKVTDIIDALKAQGLISNKIKVQWNSQQNKVYIGE